MHDCTSSIVCICTLSLLLWLMFSAGQACSLGNCTLKSTGNFNTDCDSGFIEDYVSCLIIMGCSTDDTKDAITNTVFMAYPYVCSMMEVQYSLSRLIEYLSCVFISTLRLFPPELSDMDTTENTWNIGRGNSECIFSKLITN